jgi:hypothetical protein
MIRNDRLAAEQLKTLERVSRDAEKMEALLARNVVLTTEMAEVRRKSAAAETNRDW